MSGMDRRGTLEIIGVRASEFPDEEFYYRVVRIDDSGEQTATVQFDNYDYAVKLWLRANDCPWIKRCWIERRPKGEWQVCSSETGSAFMTLGPESGAE